MTRVQKLEGACKTACLSGVALLLLGIVGYSALSFTDRWAAMQEVTCYFIMIIFGLILTMWCRIPPEEPIQPRKYEPPQAGC